jgi:hypothetical protein
MSFFNLSIIVGAMLLSSIEARAWSDNNGENQTNQADDFNQKTAVLEQKFFGVIGLRLHQINGSYTKLVAAKDQLKTHKSIINDHKKSIASLGVLIVGET